MRSFARRRLESLANALRTGPANTAIARMPITPSNDRHRRSHTPRSGATVADGEGRQPVICLRGQAPDCGPQGENVRPMTQGPRIAAALLLAGRGTLIAPAGVADAVGPRNRVVALLHRRALRHAREDIALTHDEGRVLMAPGACLDACAAFRACILGWQNGQDLLGRVAWFTRARFDPCAARPAKPSGVAAVGTEAGEAALVARRRAAAARREPSRCLKPLATSLESDRPTRRGRDEPGAAATRTSGGRTFCRGLSRRSLLQVKPAGWALRFVGAA